MKKISRLFNVYPLNKCSIDAYQNYLQTHKSKQAALQTTFSLCDILSQSGFSLATAPLLAHLSSLAYEWEQQAEELNSCELFLVQELHAQHIQYFSFKNAEAYGFVFQGVAFLVFCGTNDLSKDWVDNLMAVRQDYVSDGNQISDVHLGFMLHFERLRPQLLDWVDQVQNDADHFVCTGHSLGGSLAILMAQMLGQNEKEVLNVTTFGSPAVGGAEFVEQYLWSNRTWRVVDKGDPIPRSTPEYVGFKHVGTGISSRTRFDMPSGDAITVTKDISDISIFPKAQNAAADNANGIAEKLAHIKQRAMHAYRERPRHCKNVYRQSMQRMLEENCQHLENSLLRRHYQALGLDQVLIRDSLS